MSSTLKEQVDETNIRHAGSGGSILFINADESWSVGTNTNALVKVQLPGYTSITDETFDYSAVSIEKASNGGFTLFVRSDADQSQVVQVAVSASGQVDPSSVNALTADALAAAETSTGVDLDGNGGLGSAPVLLEGGPTNLYKSASGILELGNDPAKAVNISVNGAQLTSKMMPSNMSIVGAAPSASGGFDVFIKTSAGDVLDAQLNAKGEYVTNTPLSPTQQAAKSVALGIDVTGGTSVPAAPGWTSDLKDGAIKAAVDSALAVNGKISDAQLIAIMNGIIQAHQANANAPISGAEFADLQAIASRGSALFAGDATTVDYVSNVFAKMVNGSPANEFYTGGQASGTALGNLAANAPIANFSRLVDKWLLGGDLPSPSAGGDTATGKASTTVAVYAKSSGTMFVDGATPADVKQGQLGDCYMVAALVTIADVKPSALTSSVVDNGIINGTHTWGIRFFDSDNKANWVTVNDMLPVASAGSTQTVFGSNPTNDLNGEIWVPMLEKAYAEANMLKILPRGEKSGLDAYWAVEGGFGDPLAEIMGGGKVNAYNYVNYNWSDNPYIINNVVDRSDPAALSGLQATLTKAMNDGKPIWVGSSVKTADSFDNTLLTGGHAFSIQDANKTDPTSLIANVFNPWGSKELPTPPANVGHLSPFPYTIAQLIGMPDVYYWVLG